MVKLADKVIVKNNEVVEKVEQDSGWAFIVAAPEFLSVVFDIRSVEPETKSIHGNRVIFLSMNVNEKTKGTLNYDLS